MWGGVVLVRLGCEREASVQGVELGTFFQKRRPGAKLLGTSQRDVPGFGPFPQEEVYSGPFPTTTRRGVRLSSPFPVGGR